MTYNANAQSFLPSTVVFSQDPSQFLIQLTNLYTQIARTINAREIAYYNTDQVTTGEVWYSDSSSTTLRKGYRTVYTFGAISAGATSTQAHGLNGVSQFTHIYGTALSANPDYRCLPYASATAADDQIELLVDASNIYIIVGASSPNITSATVVLEYLYT